jgi:hypothetical protein
MGGRNLVHTAVFHFRFNFNFCQLSLFGVPLTAFDEKKSRIIMQVPYPLLFEAESG